jgi:hypothetical protein
MAPVKHILAAIGTSSSLVEWRVRRICESLEEATKLFLAGKINTAEFELRSSANFLIDAHLNVLQKASQKGIAAHSAVEAVASGDENAIAEAKKTDASTVSRFENFMSATKAEIIFAEHWMINPDLAFCARADIGLLINGERWLVDKKPKSRIFFENRLQVTAQKFCLYRITESGEKLENDFDRFGILLNNGNTFEIQPVESQFDCYCWENVRQLYQSKQKLDYELRSNQ